jgi:plasmid stabilization system protein ParE
MRSVHWTRHALDDLKQQADYIARENPSAAYRIAERIRRAGNSLGEMATGHYGRMEGTYEKLVRGTRYILVYLLERWGEDEMVAILRVIHASRDWPEGEWPE